MNETVTTSLSSRPTQVSGPTATATSGNTSGAGSGTIQLPQPPPALSALAIGQLVRAVVVGRTDDGEALVETLFGKFALNLARAYARGSVLQLQILKSGNPVELLIVAPENRPAAESPAAAIRLVNPLPAISSLAQGQLVRAVVVGPAADGHTLIETRFGQFAIELSRAPAPGSTLQLQVAKAGTLVELRVAGEPVGTSPRPINPASLSPGDVVFGRFAPARAEASTASSASFPGGRASGGAPTELGGKLAAAGHTDAPATSRGFHAKVLAIHASAPSGRSAGNETVAVGRIAASRTGGPTIVETAGSRIVLPATGGALAGKYISLHILAEPGTVLPTDPAAARLRSLTSISGGWPALEQAIDVAKANNPTVAAQFVASSIPATGPTLTAGIALFLSVLANGQLPEWLGQDLVRLLDSTNRQPLLNRLGEDFSQLVRLAGEPINNEWRVAMLPLLHENALHQVRLYLRERARRGSEREDGAGTRFVIEASLSRLGPLQLDGLVRAARFDLMVRTRDPLPADVRDDISGLFAQANRAFDVQGRIDFQVQSPFPVAPIDAVAEHAVGVYA